MAMAFGELRVAASGPDRLPDPADRPSARAVLVDELLPGRDDARRVRAHLGHVGEEHAVGVLAERPREPLDLLGVQDDEDRLAGLDPVANELEHPAENSSTSR